MQTFETLPNVSVTRETNVDAAALWQVLSDLAALPEWAPGIDGAEVTSAKTSGIGAVRRVHTAQFGPIEHHVTVWEPEACFAYITADSGPFSRTLTTYSVAPGANGATVQVTLAFEIKPGTMQPEQAKAVLNKALTATLQVLELRARMYQAA